VVGVADHPAVAEAAGDQAADRYGRPGVAGRLAVVAVRAALSEAELCTGLERPDQLHLCTGLASGYAKVTNLRSQ
jgi:hypothetical protein